MTPKWSAASGQDDAVAKGAQARQQPTGDIAGGLLRWRDWPVTGQGSSKRSVYGKPPEA